MSIAGRVLGTMFVLGAGALTIAAVVAAPRILQTARPLLREGLKRGIGLYEQARAAAAEVAEDVEDLVAEVRAEVAPEHQPHANDDQRRA